MSHAFQGKIDQNNAFKLSVRLRHSAGGAYQHFFAVDSYQYGFVK